VGNAVSEDPSSRTVLEVVYGRFVASGRWPTFEEVEDDAYRGGIGDVTAVLAAIGPEHLRGADLNPDATRRLSVTLSGLAVVAEWNDDADRDLELVARSVRFAAERALETRPPEKARLEVRQFAETVVPTLAAEAILRLGAIWLESCGHLWTSFAGSDGQSDWSCDLNRRALRGYENVATVRELLALERDRIQDIAAATGPAVTAPFVAPPAPHRAASEVPDWVHLLPIGLREAVEPRLANGQREDAMTAGWKVLARTLQARTGLDMDGDRLVNEVFGKARRISLGEETESGANLHDGYTNWMRAMARMRNVYSHPGETATTELHVAAVLLSLGECLQVILDTDDGEGAAPVAG